MLLELSLTCTWLGKLDQTGIVKFCTPETVPSFWVHANVPVCSFLY